MNELIKHPEFGEIGLKMVKGETWFAANDLCDLLGLKRQQDSVRYLDDDEKGVFNKPTPGGIQKCMFVNESGMYALILRSHRPEAKQFRKWITSEVLPSIRRNGYYVHPQMMSRKDEIKLKKQISAKLEQYLTEEDKCKIAKKFGWMVAGIDSVIRGSLHNNAVMQECQRRALANKEKELNAYHPERLLEVLGTLSR